MKSFSLLALLATAACGVQAGNPNDLPTPCPTTPSVPAAGAVDDGVHTSLDVSPARADDIGIRASTGSPVPATTLGFPYTNLKDSPARADGKGFIPTTPAPTEQPTALGNPFTEVKEEDIIDDNDDDDDDDDGKEPAQAIGVAYTATAADTGAATSQGSSPRASTDFVVPMVAAGCVAAVVGIAGFVILKKRMAESEPEIDYHAAIATPV